MMARRDEVVIASRPRVSIELDFLEAIVTAGATVTTFR
jgi:hypothetical protein